MRADVREDPRRSTSGTVCSGGLIVSANDAVATTTVKFHREESLSLVENVHRLR